MNKFHNNTIIIILFFLVGIIGFSSQVQAANCGDTNYSGITDTVCACSDTVVGAPGYTYQLSGDLNCGGVGLRIGSNGITIDGNGHSLTGGGASIGIYGYDGSSWHSGVTIKNFSHITNFLTGINFQLSTGGTIQNNIITSNSSYGIYLSGYSGFNIIDNTVNSSRIGICIYGSSGVILTNNTANSNNNPDSTGLRSAGIFIEGGRITELSATLQIRMA